MDVGINNGKSHCLAGPLSLRYLLNYCHSDMALRKKISYVRFAHMMRMCQFNFYLKNTRRVKVQSEQPAKQVGFPFYFGSIFILYGITNLFPLRYIDFHQPFIHRILVGTPTSYWTVVLLITIVD